MRWMTVARQAFRNRKKIAQILSDKRQHCKQVSDWNAEALREEGIEAILLDFDGVLGPHGALSPTPAVKIWLTALAENFSAHRIWIFSNAPTSQRCDFFAKHFPGIRWLMPPPKKPDPWVLEAMLSREGLQPSSVLFVDDRLLTGILCALLSGVRPMWISQPLCDWQGSWRQRLAELWIEGLRRLEYFLFV
jgi:predicted HAD superfamily phosphohydrolase YqeG